VRGQERGWFRVSFLNPTYHYFSSNLSEAAQNAIENQIRLTLPIDIVDLPDSVNDDEVSDPSANLLAELPLNQSQKSVEVFGSLNNVSFFSDSVMEKSPSKLSLDSFSTQQGSILQISSLHSNSFEIGIAQVGSTEIGTQKTSTHQIDSREIGVLQVTPAKFNFWQNSPTQINSTQIDINEQPLPSSITLQQLLSSHNFSLQNTTVPTWLEFLQGTTPFNLNIEVTDLPTGQLAEANITGFDPTGRPSSGTLYLDTDANGLGWYIDPTPWDNSEFSQTLTDTAYRATPDSVAYGHYDLLTTILHETAHLQGFIAGYSNYDTHIQTINNHKTFIGDAFSAILTPDGSHLNFQVNTQCPYPLQKGYRVHTSLKHFLQ
jgi:hypothetical protein